MPSPFATLSASFLLFILAASVPTPHAGGVGQPATGKAIYFLTNDAENAVVALPIAADGTLSPGTVTATGGAGSNSIDGMTNMSAAPDALVGQSSLTIAGQNLFAVNAGSDTLTMLTISASNPTHLTTTGPPLLVPGDFPNTVAASAKNHLACVGTTGFKSGISCARYSPTTGSWLSAMDALRPFELHQTTPPVGPTNTVSQTFFSGDESRLFATVKGDPATAGKPGFFSAFAVDKGGVVSRRETRSSPAGTAVLFGAALVPGSDDEVFVTDASFGAAVLSLKSDGAAVVVGRGEIGGQVATCWATVSEATGSAYVTDVGVNHVVEMSVVDASVVATYDLSPNGDPGLIDLKAAGDFVYALSPGNGSMPAAVTVLDVSGGKGRARLVQHFEVGAMGVGRNAQGMVVMM